jgi:hypothetical protein
MRVALDILIVHKERVFQQKDVWFYVYDGSLPDAMLSESLLNSIPCTSHPEETLLDTRARASDLPILFQQMDDYNGLKSFKVNLIQTECSVPKQGDPGSTDSRISLGDTAPNRFFLY